MNNELTHIDKHGKAVMVDVSSKEPLRRTATAQCYFYANETTIDALLAGNLPKGEALTVARIAGIQAGKTCGSLIPLCHPLPLEFIDVQFERAEENSLKIMSKAVITAKTGIEMEALTAVTVASLALWDMAKAIDKNLSIGKVTLVEKTKERVR